MAGRAGRASRAGRTGRAARAARVGKFGRASRAGRAGLGWGQGLDRGCHSHFVLREFLDREPLRICVLCKSFNFPNWQLAPLVLSFNMFCKNRVEMRQI